MWIGSKTGERFGLTGDPSELKWDDVNIFSREKRPKYDEEWWQFIVFGNNF